MSEPLLPPPVIGSAKLLAYPYTGGDVRFTDRINLFVGDGERLGRVPALAVCSNFYTPNDVLLLFCDEDWAERGVIGFTSVDEAKLKAEHGYEGISEKWISSPYSELEVADFLRNVYEVDPNSEWWKSICSFCGNEVAEGQCVVVPRATICASCVDQCYELLRKE